MLYSLRAEIKGLVSLVLPYFAQVLVYPMNPIQRIYWLYLATSFVAAAVAFALYQQRGHASADAGFLRFCFPKEVWGHPAAWLWRSRFAEGDFQCRIRTGQ